MLPSSNTWLLLCRCLLHLELLSHLVVPLIIIVIHSHQLLTLLHCAKRPDFVEDNVANPEGFPIADFLLIPYSCWHVAILSFVLAWFIDHVSTDWFPLKHITAKDVSRILADIACQGAAVSMWALWRCWGASEVDELRGRLAADLFHEFDPVVGHHDALFQITPGVHAIAVFRFATLDNTRVAGSVGSVRLVDLFSQPLNWVRGYASELRYGLQFTLHV
mmetsp:Transcript_62791/g.97770  ORF Transcript_62791/g.97770 Transcript_62791/m.97770 type:complete len:219 (+) Transcript_62791:267-923(+)